MSPNLRNWLRWRRVFALGPSLSDVTAMDKLRVNGEFVSGNYFRTFGLQSQAGRLFFDSDDVKGAPIVAVMSYATWQRDYLASAAVVGSTLWVNTKPVTVIGIAPRGFYGDRLSSN